MSSDVHLPPSQRSRYRARTRKLSFVWEEGKIIEETTRLELPKNNSLYVIGQPLHPDDPKDVYYFDEKGRPANGETQRRLEQEMWEHLFVIDGRLPPQVGSKPTTQSKHEWNRYLRDLGLGTLYGTETIKDPRERRRSPVRMPASAVKRFFSKRLGILFDRKEKDALVQKLSKYLSRTHGWHLWWDDPSLAPIKDELARNRWKIPYLARLESISLVGGEAPWLLHKKRQPFRVEFKSGAQTYVFAFPCWPESAVRSAKHARGIAISGLLEYGKGLDRRILAAVVWQAGAYLERPRALRARKVTLEVAGRHFGLTSRQVRYAADKVSKRLLALAAGA